MDENNTFISEDSSFEGDISAEHIVVAGTVIGNLTATSTIVIQKNGWVKGDIRAPKVYMTNGCHHDGLICLGDPDESAPDKIDIGSTSSESVDTAKEAKKKSEQAIPVSKKKKDKLW